MNIGIKYGVYIYNTYEESGHSLEFCFLLHWVFSGGMGMCLGLFWGSLERHQPWAEIGQLQSPPAGRFAFFVWRSFWAAFPTTRWRMVVAVWWPSCLQVSSRWRPRCHLELRRLNWSVIRMQLARSRGRTTNCILDDQVRCLSLKISLLPEN